MAGYATLDSPRNDSERLKHSSVDVKTASLRELFSYADAIDKLLMVIGTLGAFAAGVTQPIQIVLLGDILNSFNPTSPTTELTECVDDVVINFVYVGIAAFFCAFFQVTCWSLTAARQAKRIRKEYVNAVLSKEVGWFDVNDPMQIPTKVAEATILIQEGMGGRLADGLRFFAMAGSGITIGLVKGWELALILLAFTPFIAITAFICMKAMQAATLSGTESYGRAGAIVQEALSNVRTVHSFNAIGYFVDKYDAALEPAIEAGIKKGVTVGWGTGVMYFTVFCTYACGLYFGAVKVANDRLDGHSCKGSGCYDGGRVIVVFFWIINGAMVLGRAGPSVEAISSAKTAAYGVFQTIKNPSRINPISDEGKILETVSGRIQIKEVTFAYPSRPDVEVCNNYSLIIEAGETVALVGPSGSGKSTIVSFLERFYDPLSGSVMLDGEDLRCLNVKWLRQQIGLVVQEPVLFHTTILENICYGSPSATDEQVFDAARMANAYDFIATFPQGFATEVGLRGAQLSGGQKQRIVIARAIVRNPRVLILDEATSALDTEVELAVLDSLKHLQTRSKCTIILIAHNLSTIRDADRIAVHSHGAVVETGTHNELMNLPDGQYRTLVDEYLRGVDGGEMIAFTLDTEKQHNETKIAGSTRQNQNISDDDEVLGDEGPPISNSRIWKLSLPDWTFMAIGTVGAIANAAVFPVWGLMFTKLTMLFYAYSKTKHEMLQDARYWALGFVGLGIVFGLSVTLQNFGFAVTSQRLIARVRCLAFGRMLRQEIAWFDKPHNAPGALVARLATDSATLLVMTSEALNNGLVNVSTLGIALGISFFHSWQMTLVVLAVCPILVLAFYIQSQQMSGAAANKKNNEADAAAGSLLQEAVGSSRTVASLGMEEDLVARYSRSLEVSNNLDARIGIVGGLTFGFSLGMTFLFFAFLFYVAGKWVNNGTVSFESAFVVLMVIMLSMFAVGMTAQNATTAAVAKASAQRIFSIIDRVPAIDAVSPHGLTPSEVAGEIVFNRLQFSYPSR